MKVLNINGYRFAVGHLNEKDLQALAGFVVNLSQVHSYYDYDTSSYLYCSGSGPEVRIEEVELDPNAKAKADESYTRYKAKREESELRT